MMDIDPKMCKLCDTKYSKITEKEPYCINCRILMHQFVRITEVGYKTLFAVLDEHIKNVKEVSTPEEIQEFLTQLYNWAATLYLDNK